MIVAAALTMLLAAAEFKVPPTPDHYVTDSAGALSSGARAKIENELQAYEKSTGHQIVVWIANTTGDVPLETFTGETADQWKIGRKGKDDGAVLFLFMQDHKVRIEVGYGLESALTDADSSRIIQDDIRPKMRANDVDGAVETGVAAMLTTITPAYTGVTPPPAETSSPMSVGVVIFMVAIIVLGFGFLIVMIVLQVIGSIRYGYLVMREGSASAKRDMKRWPLWGGGMIVGGGGGSWGGGGGFGGGGFSAGGGGFGGGGASGGW